jgi:hypothetical protein
VPGLYEGPADMKAVSLVAGGKAHDPIDRNGAGRFAPMATVPHVMRGRHAGTRSTRIDLPLNADDRAI